MSSLREKTPLQVSPLSILVGVIMADLLVSRDSIKRNTCNPQPGGSSMRPPPTVGISGNGDSVKRKKRNPDSPEQGRADSPSTSSLGGREKMVKRRKRTIISEEPDMVAEGLGECCLPAQTAPLDYCMCTELMLQSLSLHPNPPPRLH